MDCVKYVGIATVRSISDKEWRDQQGIDHETLVWDSSNDHTVPVDQISEDAMKYLATDDGFIILTDTKDPPTEQEVAED